MYILSEIIQDPDILKPNSKVVHVKCEHCGDIVLFSTPSEIEVGMRIEGSKCEKCKN